MLILLCLRTSQISTSALYLFYRTAAITPLPFHASASSRPRASKYCTLLRHYPSTPPHYQALLPVTHPLRARIGAYIGAKLRKNIDKEKHHREKFPDGVILSMSGLIVATSGRGTPRVLCATRRVWQRSAASRSRRPPSPSYSQ